MNDVYYEIPQAGCYNSVFVSAPWCTPVFSCHFTSRLEAGKMLPEFNKVLWLVGWFAMVDVPDRLTKTANVNNRPLLQILLTANNKSLFRHPATLLCPSSPTQLLTNNQFVVTINFCRASLIETHSIVR